MEPLVIEKTFDAPVALVYDAWSRADWLQHWFFPGDKMTVAVTCDFRVGGSYHIAMNTEKGTWEVTGDYREIVPCSKIVFTWNAPNVPNTLVRLDFSEVGQKTHLKLTHEHFTNADDRKGHGEGWHGCLANLTGFLAGKEQTTHVD